MTRWTIALGASLFIHMGPAVGTLGWQKAPSFEATPGQARVALVFRSKPSPPRTSWNLNPEPVPRKKIVESAVAIPELEGVESSAPWSLHNPPPPYPAEAFRRGIQGVTSLFVHVNSHGTASQIVMERSSGSILLDEAAVSAVAKWTFVPARRAGIQVPGSIRIRVRFQIVEMEESL